MLIEDQKNLGPSMEKVFFKEIILDDSLGKTKFYATRNEFQERDRHHARSFTRIFIAPNIQNKASLDDFFKKNKCAVATPTE